MRLNTNLNGPGWYTHLGEVVQPFQQWGAAFFFMYVLDNISSIRLNTNWNGPGCYTHLGEVVQAFQHWGATLFFIYDLENISSIRLNKTCTVQEATRTWGK